MKIAAFGGGVAALLFLTSHWWLILGAGVLCGWLARGYSERRKWQRFRDRTEAEYGVLRNRAVDVADVSYLPRRDA
jgi:hypothetical protein